MSKNWEKQIRYKLIIHRIKHPIRAYKIHKIVKVLKNSDLLLKLKD